MSEVLNICIIGSGQVSRALALRMQRCSGVSVQQVFGRNKKNVTALAKAAKTQGIISIDELHRGADCYIIAVSDRAIAEVGAQLAAHLPKNALLVHTSGATPAKVLADCTHNFGVFYPLQSFTTGIKPNFNKIPLCIDAAEAGSLAILQTLGQRIGQHIYTIDDKQRAHLHVAAVMVNNFTNHLYQLAADELATQGLSLDILKPLIQETTRKIMDHEPHSVQTGPAKRGDLITMERHQAILAHNPNPALAHIYQLLSNSISDYENRRKH